MLVEILNFSSEQNACINDDLAKYGEHYTPAQLQYCIAKVMAKPGDILPPEPDPMPANFMDMLLANPFDSSKVSDT